MRDSWRIISTHPAAGSARGAPAHLSALLGHCLDQWFPTFGTGDQSVEDNFSMDGEKGWFQDDSSTLHLSCTLFLLLHQLYLTSSDIRSLRLGISGLDWRELCSSGTHPFLRQPTSNNWSTWLDQGLDSLLQCTIALRSIASLELCARSAEAIIKALLHSTFPSAQTGFLLFSIGIDLKNSH